MKISKYLNLVSLGKNASWKSGKIITSHIKLALSKSSPITFLVFRPVNAAILSSLFVFFIAFFIKPFGVGQKTIHNQFIVSLAVSMVPALIYIIIFTFFKRALYFYTERWSLKFELIYIFFIIFPFASLLIFITIALLFIYLGGDFSLLSELQHSFYYTYSVGILIYILLKIFDYILYFYYAAKDSEKVKNTFCSGLKIVSNSNNGILIVEPKDLIYVEASKNDIIINYKLGKKEVQAVMRKTLREFEEQVEKYPFLFRCQKSFVVNVKFIERIDFVANKNFAILITGDKVPISKNKMNQLDELFYLQSHQVLASKVSRPN